MHGSLTMDRRDLLKLGGFGALSCAAGWGRQAQAAAQPGAPRYIVSILLNGGMDAVLTTDPKTRSQVERWVDVPYSANRIVSTRAGQVGPLLRPFAPLLGAGAILNGVQVRSANHVTGRHQFRCMRTRINHRVPSFLELAGGFRDGQPLGLMNDSWFAPRPLSLLRGAATGDEGRTAALVQALRHHAERAGASSQAIARRYAEAAALLSRLKTIPPPPTEDTFVEGVPFTGALWALENDLTRCFAFDIGGDLQIWDSHSFNYSQQVYLAETFFPAIANFLAQLRRRKNAHGDLASNTLVVIGSEIGRFPRLNAMQGKDHLPEVPLLFFGRGIAARPDGGALFGATGRRMEALPISLETGRPEAGGTQVTLDDVGRTLLHLAGVPDADLYGFDGRLLKFLLA